MRSLALGIGLLSVVGATACGSTVRDGAAVAPSSGSVPPSVSSLAPSVISAAPASSGQLPLTGPQVSDAALFATGNGYVRTQQGLLWTNNLGATWRNITPPGLSHAQLQSAGIAVQPDGHEWVAVAPGAGSSSVTLMRRPSVTSAWTTTSVPLGPLSISPYAALTTYLSFTDANNGWLLVGEQITHSAFGELLRSTDGGLTWTTQAAESTLPVIGSIRFLTAQIGYLDTAWNGAWWWTTRDAGHSWVRLDLPVPAAKKSDSVNIIDTPTLAGGAIVLAATFTTPNRGEADGVGIYRSTDSGATWTVQQLSSEAPNEQYKFAATTDGSTYVLLRERTAPDYQSSTWVTSSSTNRGESFTNASSVHNFYPGRLTLADPDHLWTVGSANGCKTFKAGCWRTTGLVASNDGGRTWRQVKLPS